MGVLIVGASLAGLRTAQALRGNGYDGEIVLAGAEADLPYDRPPLSKEFLVGTAGDDDIRLCTKEDLDGSRVDFRAGWEATSAAFDERKVDFANGEVLAYDHLVIATGARPRRLAAFDGWDGVHVLRSVEDARRLRDALAGGPDVAIVGGGFIGAEVASSATSSGCRVTVLEALDAPMARVLGPVVGGRLGRLVTEAGVDLRCRTTVIGPAGSDRRVERVEVAGADAIDASVVVVAVGIQPNVEWLAGSGAVIDNGVVCDDSGRVVGATGVYAVGDGAAWVDPVTGAPHRSEHWTAATEHAEVVAQLIANGERTLPPQVPYVWSDQFGHRIQVAGRFAGGEVEVVRDTDDGFVAIARSGDVLGGVVAVDTPRALAVFRKLLAAKAPWPDALAQAEKLRG